MKRLLLLVLLLPWLADAQLSEGDVRRVIAQAASRAEVISPSSLIAVVDTEGTVVGAWDVSGRRPALALTEPGLTAAVDVALAVSKAGTASFLSSNQNAFTSRTAGFIVGPNFPPGARNRPPGPLVGVGLSNLCFSDGNKFKGPGTVRPFSIEFDANDFVVPVLGAQLFGSPGGVPLYKNGRLVGGVGVTGDSTPAAYRTNRNDIDEDVALAGQIGYQPRETIRANHVFIDGVSLPYVEGGTNPGHVKAFSDIKGEPVESYPIQGSPPPFPFIKTRLGGNPGEIRRAIKSDPQLGVSRIRGQERLSADEVRSILSLAAARAKHTRAGIRLPRGQAAQVWITVVANPDKDGTRPEILGVFRTQGATMFSYDVAIQKARTALFFSTDDFASSTRTVGFLAQPNYPPGLEGHPAGPYFGTQEDVSITPGTQARALQLKSPQRGFVLGANPSRDGFHPQPLNQNVPNGITIFPGGFPLYRNGILIGAIGVSGDGIDQDDLISASGCRDFLAPDSIRADQSTYRGARLPYAKFPRDPDL